LCHSIKNYTKRGIFRMKHVTNPEQCQTVVALDTIVGKWKPVILYILLEGKPLRFNELRRRIPDITQRMLTMHLRELEEQDIVHREVYAQVPPKVEYTMTEYGKTLAPILEAMNEWGAKHIQHMNAKFE